MAMNHRVFIAFAVEDQFFRDALVGQARNERTPFEFTDMSVKEPWDRAWKDRVRTRIKGCDGVIALVSTNTHNADGARYEMQVAIEEHVPMIGLYVNDAARVINVMYPIRELASIRIIKWTWDGIAAFLNTL